MVAILVEGGERNRRWLANRVMGQMTAGHMTVEPAESIAEHLRKFHLVERVACMAVGIKLDIRKEGICFNDAQDGGEDAEPPSLCD